MKKALQTVLSLSTKTRLIQGTILVGALSGILTACAAGGGSIAGNEGGSEPVNDREAVEYKKAIVRCYKTGGTRVVKIMGELRCY